MSHTILHGDCREKLAELPTGHFHCCVTSPPYFGLRDYGTPGQIGLEATPEEFVEAMVEVFQGVWRVLRDDGVAWLNLGDSYCNAGSSRNGEGLDGKRRGGATGADGELGYKRRDLRRSLGEIKHKDLMGMPWRVAFSLQSAGWYLRDAIVWHKPAPMPGSQQDRCTSSYEFIFQLTKRSRYFFDMEAIKEPPAETSVSRYDYNPSQKKGDADDLVNQLGHAHNPRHMSNVSADDLRSRLIGGSTPRNVWKMATEGFKGAHFATFPISLPLRCIKASTSAVGCCPNCGAPWRRIVDRTALTRERPNEFIKRNGEPGTGNSINQTVAGVEARTLGWEATCDCGEESKTPCRALDPFHGAGTTMIAARRLGLDYTGCELNQEYIDLSRARLNQEMNRGADFKPVKPAAGQLEFI